MTGGVTSKLGFSPDEADAVVMAWHEGERKRTHAAEWIDRTMNAGRPTQAITSRPSLTARRYRQ